MQIPEQWALIASLLALALIITTAIAGTAFLFWYFSADSLKPDKIKRSNRGRRRSDQ